MLDAPRSHVPHQCPAPCRRLLPMSPAWMDGSGSRSRNTDAAPAGAHIPTAEVTLTRMAESPSARASGIDYARLQLPHRRNFSTGAGATGPSSPTNLATAAVPGAWSPCPHLRANQQPPPAPAPAVLSHPRDLHQQQAWDGGGKAPGSLGHDACAPGQPGASWPYIPALHAEDPARSQLPPFFAPGAFVPRGTRLPSNPGGRRRAWGRASQVNTSPHASATAGAGAAAAATCMPPKATRMANRKPTRSPQARPRPRRRRAAPSGRPARSPTPSAPCSRPWRACCLPPTWPPWATTSTSAAPTPWSD